MKKIMLFLLVIGTTANADTLYGLYTDVNYWHTNNQHTTTNFSQSHKTTSKDNGQVMLSASLEHGIPLIPNAKIRHSTLDGKANQKLSNSDAIAYYEVLDNVVSLDIGLGAKRLKGDIENNAGDYNAHLSKTLPMVYASAGAKLPFTGLSAKAELGIAHNSKIKANDAQAELKYNFVDNALVDIGIKAGYRILTIKNDDIWHDAKTKTGLDKNSKPTTEHKSDFKGPYVGVEMHF